MTRFFSLIIAVATLVAAAFAFEARAQSDHVLDAGDRVKITVFGEADLSGEFEVDGSGTFSFPLIGTIRVAGLTARQLEEELDRQLRGDYLVNPRINIEVLTVRPVFVLGEVKSPGSYPFRPGMTVINLVAAAGGFTPRADEGDIEISRGGEGGATIEARPATRVFPGDVVRVKERFF